MPKAPAQSVSLLPTNGWMEGWTLLRGEIPSGMSQQPHMKAWDDIAPLGAGSQEHGCTH